MYFYIDETGNTGLNLFDENQPLFIYGLLVSPTDLNLSAAKELAEIKSLIGAQRVHANELGFQELQKILPHLIEIDKKNHLSFDCCVLDKKSWAFISFFEQVFDQGLNKAVPWGTYWTPLRYTIILHLHNLFDDELLKKSWNAKLNKNKKLATEEFMFVADVLKKKVKKLKDKRAKQIIHDALAWSMSNPEELVLHSDSKVGLLMSSPNLLVFQSILFKIRDASKKIIGGTFEVFVDQQSQYNKSQEQLRNWYAKLQGQKFSFGPGLPELDFSGVTEKPIIISSGTECFGLDLVDVYVWLFKRKILKDDLPADLDNFIMSKILKMDPFIISMGAIAMQRDHFAEQMFSLEMNEEKKREAIRLLNLQEKLRQTAMKEVAKSKSKIKS